SVRVRGCARRVPDVRRGICPNAPRVSTRSASPKSSHVTVFIQQSQYGIILPRLFFGQIGLAEGVLGLRDRQQGWIELHEGGVHGPVFLVALVALRGLRLLGPRPFAAETEEGPAALEPLVLHMRLAAQHVG